MSNTIYASFNDPSSAERAVGALLDHGARKEDISVVSSHDGAVQVTDTESTEGLAYEPVFGYNPALGAVAVPPVYPGIPVPTEPATNLDAESATYAERPDSSAYANDNTYNPAGTSTGNQEIITDSSTVTEAQAKEGITTTTAGDAGEGAIKGTAWGAGLGILAGIAALAVPGVGLVYGGGALAMAIGAAAATAAAGAAAGAVTGYLIDQGVDSQAAEDFERSINAGGAVLAVTVPSNALGEVEARQILTKYAAKTIDAARTQGYVS